MESVFVISISLGFLLIFFLVWGHVTEAVRRRDDTESFILWLFTFLSFFIVSFFLVSVVFSAIGLEAAENESRASMLPITMGIAIALSISYAPLSLLYIKHYKRKYFRKRNAVQPGADECWAP
ncbi:MAG: hypothetical protein M1355_01445 [Patescibacteria group bacterium]|nr:hypothetical protein [Patescibacteria group bacterium]